MEAQEIFSREDYHAIRVAWSAYIQERPEGGNWNHLLYTLIRGKDPLTAFKPLTNPIKIENNNGRVSITLDNALYRLCQTLKSHALTLDALANPTDPKHAYRIKTVTSSKFFFNHLDGKTSFELNAEQTQHLIAKTEVKYHAVD